MDLLNTLSSATGSDITMAYSLETFDCDSGLTEDTYYFFDGITVKVYNMPGERFSDCFIYDRKGRVMDMVQDCTKGDVKTLILFRSNIAARKVA